MLLVNPFGPAPLSAACKTGQANADVTAETIQAEVDAKPYDNEAVLGWIRTKESALHQMNVASCPPNTPVRTVNYGG